MYEGYDCWTDKDNYEFGKTVVIFLQIPPKGAGAEYFLRIYKPDGSTIEVDIGILPEGIMHGELEQAGPPEGQRKVELWGQWEGQWYLKAYCFYNVKAGFDFEISAEPSSQTIKQGESASFRVTVTSLTSSVQTVSLSLSGLHETMSYRFDLSSGSPTFTSTLTVTTSTFTPTGTYALTITGRDGGKAHSTSVWLILEKVVTEISIAGGRSEYQGVGRPVFFRGSNIKVSIRGSSGESTYGLEIADSDDIIRIADYSGPWAPISTITTSQQTFDFPIPNSAPIGVYRVSSSMGRSDIFYVIFDPGLEHNLPREFWSEARVNVVVVAWPVTRATVAQTRHFDSHVLEWSLFVAYNSKHPEEAVRKLNIYLLSLVGKERWLPKLSAPDDIYDDIISKWGEPGTIPTSPVEGDCKWVAATEVALARSIGIPATTVGGFWFWKAHCWVEHFVFDAQWKLIVSDSMAVRDSTAGSPKDARYSMSDKLLEGLEAWTGWITVRNADGSSLSADGIWGPYTSLIEQGYDHAVSGTTVSLEETGHKLYLHIYDSEGHHVGLNHETRATEVNIPGSGYYESDSMVVVFLPLETTTFRYVVDAEFASSPTESCNITICAFRQGLATSEIRRQESIRQGEKHDHEIEVASDGKGIWIDAPWWVPVWDRYSMWLLGGAFVVIAVSGIGVYASRRWKRRSKISEFKYCISCGEKLRSDAKYCLRCGEKQETGT